MSFVIIGNISRVETIARGNGVKARQKLRIRYGSGNWRKMKGVARVQLLNGSVRIAEVHWYEANGIGRKDFKIKKFLD